MKIIRIFFIGIAIIITAIFLIAFILNKPIPQGKEGIEAELLADKMLAAINKPAFDSLEFIAWDYPRGHSFQWNKKQNYVIVSWDENRVELFPDTMKGNAFIKGEKISDEASDPLIQKAWSLFANDSFWLIAPFKIRDNGTIRSLVKTEQGDALLVTYTTGGVTPGDSYLWILDEEGLPIAWQMWVKIIPIGGLSFSWESWINPKNVQFSTLHKGPISTAIELKIKEIR